MGRNKVELRCKKGCRKSIERFELDQSGEFTWLVVKCPHCNREIAQVLTRDVNKPSSVSYEGFVTALEEVIELSPKALRGGLAKSVRRGAAEGIALVILSKENLKRVEEEAASQRIALVIDEEVEGMEA